MSALLREFNQLDYTIEELNEDGKPKRFKLKGIYQAADVPNGNRIYPRAVLESAVNSVQESIKERRMLGELDHPNDAKIHLDKVSHVITKLEMNPSGQVYGEAEVLPTVDGKILESLLRAGVKLGVSSRGFGTTKNNAQGLDEVQQDYKLVTFDIVSDPSTPGAFPRAVYEDKNKVKEDTRTTTDLNTFLEDSLSKDVEIEKDIKELICTDGKGTRFYIVEGEKDSYGFLNFHVSHDFHVLVKNEDYQERIGLNKENLSLIEDVHGSEITNKILAKLNELGYNSKTLTRIKED